MDTYVMCMLEKSTTPGNSSKNLSPTCTVNGWALMEKLFPVEKQC